VRDARRRTGGKEHGVGPPARFFLSTAQAVAERRRRQDARQEGALLAGDAVRRLDVASSPAASVEEGARRLRCRGAPPARPESGDAPRRGGAHQLALVQARAHSRRRLGPSAPAGEMRRGWGDSRRVDAGGRGDRRPAGR
jgi:hypothetical protein